MLVAEQPDLPAPVDVAEEAILRLRRSATEQALGELPEPQRLAIVLMDICGLTAAETAQVTGSPRGTVLARAYRGRQALALALRGEPHAGASAAAAGHVTEGSIPKNGRRTSP